MEILKLEQRSTYTLAGVHDGNIYGVSILDETELKLDFKNLQGDKWSMTVGGILALKIDNFRQGNIVLDVDFYEADSCPLDLVYKVFGYCEEDVKRDLPPEVQNLAGLPWFLMEISPSYGCELLALSRNSIDSVVLRAIE